MFIVDMLKETILLCVLVVFATIVVITADSLYSLPEYVWHLKAR